MAGQAVAFESPEVEESPYVRFPQPVPVFGARSFTGDRILEIAGPNPEVQAAGRVADITKYGQVKEVVAKNRGEFVINLTVETDVDAIEKLKPTDPSDPAQFFQLIVKLELKKLVFGIDSIILY